MVCPSPPVNAASTAARRRRRSPATASGTPASDSPSRQPHARGRAVRRACGPSAGRVAPPGGRRLFFPDRSPRQWRRSGGRAAADGRRRNGRMPVQRRGRGADIGPIRVSLLWRKKTLDGRPPVEGSDFSPKTVKSSITIVRRPSMTAPTPSAILALPAGSPTSGGAGDRPPILPMRRPRRRVQAWPGARLRRGRIHRATRAADRGNVPRVLAGRVSIKPTHADQAAVTLTEAGRLSAGCRSCPVGEL